MRISPISSMNYRSMNCRRNSEPTSLEKTSLKNFTDEHGDKLSFKGKGGFYTGLIIGGGAVTALAIAVMSPLIACGAALASAVGAAAGDTLENKIKGDKD